MYIKNTDNYNLFLIYPATCQVLPEIEYLQTRWQGYRLLANHGRWKKIGLVPGQ
jgi:hypothetical protein